MAVPKSVTKVKNGNVEFVSELDWTQYTLAELSRAALRDAAKILKQKTKAEAPVFRGVLRDNIDTWVKKIAGQDLPELEIGILRPAQALKKKKKHAAWHAHLVILGARGGRMPANDFLTRATLANISVVREIQGQYLSAIGDKNKAESLISEGDYDGEEFND